MKKKIEPKDFYVVVFDNGCTHRNITYRVYEGVIEFCIVHSNGFVEWFKSHTIKSIAELERVCSYKVDAPFLL